MEQNQNTSLFSLNLDAQNSYTLRSAASWAKVLGVVSLIIGILCVILGILVQQVISRGAINDYDIRDSGMSMSAIGNMGMAVYVLMGLIYVLSGVFAMNAGNKINRGLRTNDQATLNAGFAGARNFFALWAILMILLLLLIVISMLGSLAS
jgi:magnesium-transporting ATPase (P-type)